MNAAERHEYLVDLGVRTYRETFIRLFKQEVAGGRIPGTAEMDQDDVGAFFQQTDPAYWQNLAQTNPQEALRQLNAFAAVEGV